MSRRVWHRGRNSMWQWGKIKDCHSLYWKDQIWLGGHVKDDEIGQQKNILWHTEAKRRQTELIWLPVPICKVFSSPEKSLRPPLSLYHLSPLPCLSTDILITVHSSTFEVFLHAESFFERCQGSRPSSQNTENGTGEKCLQGGADLYSRSHRRYTSSKPKIEKQ